MKLDDKTINELFVMGGIEEVRKHAQKELETLNNQRIWWRNERVWWQLWFVVAIVSTVLFGVSMGGCVNAEGREALVVGNSALEKTALAKKTLDASAKAERYRVMLLENKIDPETGKVWSK